RHAGGTRAPAPARDRGRDRPGLLPLPEGVHALEAVGPADLGGRGGPVPAADSQDAGAAGRADRGAGALLRPGLCRPALPRVALITVPTTVGTRSRPPTCPRGRAQTGRMYMRAQLEPIYEDVLRRNPAEPEFHQAVLEVFE